MTQPKTIKIDNVEYIRADAAHPEVSTDGRECVIIRSYGAGVFCGYVREWDPVNRIVTLDRCIRMHAWTGCSLSQVAIDGTAGHGTNRFAMPTNGHMITQVIEKIPCLKKARAAIEAVETWKQ